MAVQAWVYLSVHPNKKVKIDRTDLKRVSQHSWRITTGTTGRIRVVTSIRGPTGVKNVTLGKFLMNPPKGKQVYPRRFNDGLDYRKDNLVVCTVSERQRQLPKNRKKATSNYRGVSFSKFDKRWRAAIQVEGRSINLGHFKTETQAAAAYNAAAKKHFGASAYQNQIGSRNYKRRD